MQRQLCCAIPLPSPKWCRNQKLLPESCKPLFKKEKKKRKPFKTGKPSTKEILERLLCSDSTGRQLQKEQKKEILTLYSNIHILFYQQLDSFIWNLVFILKMLVAAVTTVSLHCWQHGWLLLFITFPPRLFIPAFTVRLHLFSAGCICPHQYKYFDLYTPAILSHLWLKRHHWNQEQWKCRQGSFFVVLTLKNL